MDLETVWGGKGKEKTKKGEEQEKNEKKGSGFVSQNFIIHCIQACGKYTVSQKRDPDIIDCNFKKD